jgi:hypothetical protein
MPERTPVTAADLLAELSRDPEYQARRKARDETIAHRRAVRAADERALVSEIQALGYGVTTVSDLVNNVPHSFLPRPFVGPYERAYPTLARHLRVPHERAVRESIIRALTIRDGGSLVEEALLGSFRTETDPGLRWVLANALRVAMPYRRRRRHPEIAAAYENGGPAQQQNAAVEPVPE